EVKEEAKQPEVKAEEKAEEKKSSEADNQKDAEYELIAKNSVRIKKHAEVFIKALNNAVPGQKDDDFNSAYTVIDNARKGKVETAQEIKESVETVKQYVTGKMKVSSGKEKKRFDCCMRFLEDAMPRKEFETLCDDINKARGVENNRKDPNYVYPEQYINTITTAGRMLRRVTQRVKDGIGTERDIAFVAALRDFSADFKDEFEDAIYMTREERRANADKYDYSLNEVTKDNFRDLGEYTELIQKSKGFKEFMKYADKEVIDRIMNDEDGQMVDLIHFVNKAPIEHMEELIGRYKEGNSNAEIVIDDFIKEENEKKINAAKQDGWVIYGDVQQENELKEKLKEEHRKIADKIKAEWDVISPEEVEAIKAEEKAKILENWEDISREEADAIKAEEKKAKETATKKISEGWEEISPEEVAAIKAEEKAERDKAAKKKSADVNKDEKRRKLSKNELGELFGNIKESAIKRKNTMPSKRAAHKDEKAAVDDGNQIKKKNTFSKK
ncbi:MAG: hypothetical protein K6F97_02920, partial [Lachnospiraceae bacterium]|nr:hypothetical protein [Lachnospiraceae bacterium]